MISEFSSEVKSILKSDEQNGAYNVQPVQVEGVISAIGQGVSIEDTFDMHMFSLSAWRLLPEGGVNESELLILRSVPTDHDCDNEFKPGTTHRFRLLLSQSQERSIFLSSAPVATSDLFSAHARDVVSLVTIELEPFGQLVLDKALNCFDGESSWNGGVVRISIAALESSPHPKALKTLRAIFADHDKWRSRVESFAGERLLPLKNDKWLRENERKLSAESFIRSLELETIEVDSDGSYKFWYSDGGLFWGHGITVRGSIESGPLEAHLNG